MPPAFIQGQDITESRSIGYVDSIYSMGLLLSHQLVTLQAA